MRQKNLLILISAAAFASARADAPDGVFTVNFQSPSGNIVCGGDTGPQEGEEPWHGVPHKGKTMSKKIKAGIVGATGYTGVELLRLLAAHPDVEVAAVTSRSEAGTAVADYFPSLRGAYGLAFQTPEQAGLEQCDIVFFATPNGIAMKDAPRLIKQGVSCFIHETGNTKPAMPKPKGCGFDWGNVFNIDNKGKAYMSCYSDYPYSPEPPVLAYGSSIKGTGWQCGSLENGVLCTNSAGHGFLLNRKRQRMF